MRADSKYFEKKQEEIDEIATFVEADEELRRLRGYRPNPEPWDILGPDILGPEVRKPLETTSVMDNKEDAFLIECIKQYIKMYSTDTPSLQSLCRMMGIWCGTDNIPLILKKKLKECIDLVTKTIRESTTRIIASNHSNIQIGDNNSY